MRPCHIDTEVGLAIRSIGDMCGTRAQLHIPVVAYMIAQVGHKGGDAIDMCAYGYIYGIYRRCALKRSAHIAQSLAQPDGPFPVAAADHGQRDVGVHTVAPAIHSIHTIIDVHESKANSGVVRALFPGLAAIGVQHQVNIGGSGKGGYRQGKFRLMFKHFAHKFIRFNTKTGKWQLLSWAAKRA